MIIVYVPEWNCFCLFGLVFFERVIIKCFAVWHPLNKILKPYPGGGWASLEWLEIPRNHNLLCFVLVAQREHLKISVEIFSNVCVLRYTQFVILRLYTKTIECTSQPKNMPLPDVLHTQQDKSSSTNRSKNTCTSCNKNAKCLSRVIFSPPMFSPTSFPV